jgi:conjugal transfer pilus assembly protein TraK
MLTAKTNDETSTYEIDEGYLYVTVNTKNPISIVLYQEGVLESQVSITLVPVPAPPTLVEIEFNLDDDMLAKAREYKREMEIKQQIASQQPQAPASNSYQQAISDILLPVAQGNIPRGFALNPTIPREARFPCSMTIYHEAKQRLVSSKHTIDVVHVVNDSTRTYNVREEMCLGRYVKAVALFEKAYLAPGEESEMYILRDQYTEQRQEQRPRRPRLTGMGE